MHAIGYLKVFLWTVLQKKFEDLRKEEDVVGYFILLAVKVEWFCVIVHSHPL